MRKALLITGLLLAGLAALALIRALSTPPATPVDLPWQIETLPDGNARVFGLTLGESTLADVMAKLGPPEGIALFASPQGVLSLEAYFGTVNLGPFRARFIVTLAAEDQELDGLRARARHQEFTPSGSTKLLLPDALARAQVQRTLKSITYIPSYSGLDEAAVRRHFGEPAREQRLEDNRVHWFFPDKGIDILIDPEGKEIFQYQTPWTEEGLMDNPVPEQGGRFNDHRSAIPYSKRA